MLNSTRALEILQNEEAYRTSLMAFQTFLSLNVTGELDTPTKCMMKMPRCGFPDVHTMLQNYTDGLGDNTTYPVVALEAPEAVVFDRKY